MKGSLTSEARDVTVPVVSTDPKSTTRKDTRRSSTVCVWGPQSIVYEYQYYFIGSLEIYARSLWGTLNVSAGLWIGQSSSCGNVIFSQVSVYHSVWGRVPMMHLTLPHREPPTPSIQGPFQALVSPLLVTSGDQDWRLVQTYSFEEPTQALLTSGGWLLQHV